MELKINGTVIESPDSFTVTVNDLDDSSTSGRSADGTTNRDRITVKRSIEMSWRMIKWSALSDILKLSSDIFFEFTYPDPMLGVYATKTFYVGNRPASTVLSKDGDIYWRDFSMSIVER
jgi:hypothetical protein